MEPGHLVEDGRRQVGTARRHLVTLGAADDVLEEEGEPTGLRFDLGHVGGGDTGLDPSRHLTVEADLDLVGPQGQAGAPALVVGRGELADDGGRARRLVVPGVGQGEAGGVGHLARADGRAGDVLDPGPRLHGSGPGQRVGQPLRRDVGRGVQQGDRAHGGTRCDGPARRPVRRAAQAGQAVAAGREARRVAQGGLRVPQAASASAQAV